MSTSEKNLFNTIFLIVLFVALVYLSQPLDSSSIGLCYRHGCSYVTSDPQICT